MENSNNVIKIGGRICSDFVLNHEAHGKEFFRFDVEVLRLSGSTDVLPVIASERILNRESTKPGMYVQITGQIRSYNIYVPTDRRNKFVLTIFAKDIILPEPRERTDPNDVFFNGYLCKPPVYRTTPFGREIADLHLAVNLPNKKSSYIPCIAWRHDARLVEKLGVGENIRIWGRMQSRQYQKQNENGEVLEKTAYEVSISKIEVAETEEFG